MPPEAAAAPTFADLQRPLPPHSPRAWRFAARARGRPRRRAAQRRAAHRLHATASTPGRSWPTSTPTDPPGAPPLGPRDRPAAAASGAPASRSATSARSPSAPCSTRSTRRRRRAPVVADLAAGPAPYLLRALAARPATPARSSGDIDAGGARGAPAAAASALGSTDRVTYRARRRLRPRRAGRAATPAPTSSLELGLYGIYHDDARIERHFLDLAELVAPQQIVFNVQTRNPEIEHIARVWRNAAGERCVWRLRPVEQILGYAARGRLRARDDHGRPLRHLPRRAARARGRRHEQRADLDGAPGRRRRRSAVAAPARAPGQPPRDVELRHLPRRDRAASGSTPTTLYPEGTTRLPADWADLGWLTCFCGPPASAPCEAMRDARSRRGARPVHARPDRAAARRGRARARPRPATRRSRSIGTEGAQAGARAVAAGRDRPRRRGHPRRPRLLPPPLGGDRRGRPSGDGARRARQRLPARPRRASRAAITPAHARDLPRRPRQPVRDRCSTGEVLAALAGLAERHGLLLDPRRHPRAAGHRPRQRRWRPCRRPGSPSARSRRSRSRTAGAWPARASGFLAGPRALMRGCLQLKAALTRLNTNLDLPARRAGRAARRGLPAAAARDDPRQPRPPRGDAGAASTALRLAGPPAPRPGVRGRDRPRGRPTAQELMVALFARRVAVYPGDGLGESRRRRTPSGSTCRSPSPAAMEHLRAVLPEALDEAAAGRWREPVAELLERQGHRSRAAVAARRPGRQTRQHRPEGERAMSERLIVIGGGGAGTSAATIAKRLRPGPERVAVHRVRGHRLLAVRDPVRARRRDPALRGPVPVDRRPLRRRRPRHAHGDGDHRHRPRPRHRHRAQPARGLRQADHLHGLHVGEARRPRREPRGPALRQEHPQGDGVRQAARRGQARRRRRRHAARRRDGRQPRPPRPRGRLHRRGPVGRSARCSTPTSPSRSTSRSRSAA